LPPLAFMIGGMADATQILEAVRAGRSDAAAELFPLVYDELKRVARAQMAGEGVGHTLQATALVNETYLRLFGAGGSAWENRRHFFAAAGEAMRRILIEHARAKRALKRGGGQERVDLESALPLTPPCENLDELLELDGALARFEQEDPGKAALVKLLHFAGMSLSEAAAACEISLSTAKRHWTYARAWLRDAVGGSERKSQ
jgi:RNA polymerase sigma factor (TIGR02999 family)